MLSYGGHTYEMLPFVVVDEVGVKKLNFPRLADENTNLQLKSHQTKLLHLNSLKCLEK